MEEMPDNVCLGCEWITCIDEFEELNGATMFVPGSFNEKYRPPPETAAEHPHGAEHLEAPAGTALLFDIRTWHRNHWNRSGAP